MGAAIIFNEKMTARTCALGIVLKRDDSAAQLCEARVLCSDYLGSHSDQRVNSLEVGKAEEAGIL